MQKEILFASHNVGKVNEVRHLLPETFSLLSLNDIAWDLDLPEPFFTFEENAKSKAYYVFDRTGLDCFADDSGLEIDALDGRPGVFSARYAGNQKNSDDNIAKVLEELGDNPNRAARFHAVIAYVSKQHPVTIFRGTVKGRINFKPAGQGGFGYDPVFIPDGFEITFGDMDEKMKNKISHRAIAMQQFLQYLKNSNVGP